jgi:DNA-binding MarR family transcriptional regulator
MAQNPNRIRSDQVLTTLRRIIRASDIHSKHIARESGLTTPQIVILRAIEGLGEVTTRVLSHEVSLSQATVTLILDRLVERELVERYRSSTDRRVVHSRLTKQGKKAISNAPRLLQETFLTRFQRLPARRQKEIVAALEEISDMMGAGSLDAAPIIASDVGFASRQH